MSMEETMEPEFEHIDWNDIVDAELSGDKETLGRLRNQAKQLKHSRNSTTHSQHHSPTSHSSLPHHRPKRHPSHKTHSTPHNQQSSAVNIAKKKTLPPPLLPPPSHLHLPPPQSSSPQLSSLLPFEDYPELTNSMNLENIPSVGYTPPPSTSISPTSNSYAQAVWRNPKRALVDRCTSPNEVPLKRSATRDIMTTPTEYRSQSRVFQTTGSDSTTTTTATTATHSAWQTPMMVGDSPTKCDATPESTSVQGKGELVQRRLFGALPDIKTDKSDPKDAEKLTDTHRLAQRQKQIDFGKNTVGYERFTQTMPRWKRMKGDPTTPDKYLLSSSRAWQGQIRVWRKLLHKYDPPLQDPQQNFTSQEAALCDIDFD